MQDKHRMQRQAKRAEAKRKKRANVSRAGVGGPAPAGSAGGSVTRGLDWPTGECFVSEGWDEPGARIDAVFSRSQRDGATILAVFEIDRSGPGLVAARAVGGARREHVAGQSGALSERSGRAMIACAPGVIAALVDDARAHGSASVGGADAVRMLEGVPRSELPEPFGPQGAASPDASPAADGWLGGLRKRWFGGS